MGLWPLKNLEKIGENSSWLGAQLCNLHQRNLTSIQSTIITYIITIFGRVHGKFSVPWVHNRTPKNISNCNCNCLELLKTSFFAVFDWFFDWFWVDTVSVGHAMSTNGAPPALNRGSPRGEPHHHVVAMVDLPNMVITERCWSTCSFLMYILMYILIAMLWVHNANTTLLRMSSQLPSAWLAHPMCLVQTGFEGFFMIIHYFLPEMCVHIPNQTPRSS